MRKFVLLLLCVGFTSAQAAQIIATPTESSGGFRHNVFHTAGSRNGTSGTVLAWYDLDMTQTSTWDSGTGALTLYVDVFTNSSLTTLIGKATGTSPDLAGANFSAPGSQDGGLIGTIDWTFDAPVAAVLGTPSITMSFIDHDYATSSDGFNANSLELPIVTLWGADGTYDDMTGAFDTNSTTLGTDLTFQVVPVPAAVWFFGSALGLLGWIRRKAA